MASKIINASVFILLSLNSVLLNSLIVSAQDLNPNVENGKDDKVITDLLLTMLPWKIVSENPNLKPSCPEDYERIDFDLNLETGFRGDAVYLCKRRQGQGELTRIPVNAIFVHATENYSWKCPDGFEDVRSDFGSEYPTNNANSGAGGALVKLCISRPITMTGKLLEDVTVVKNSKCPKGYSFAALDQRQRVDLNKDTGGEQLFLCSKYVDDHRFR